MALGGFCWGRETIPPALLNYMFFFNARYMILRL